CKIAWSGGVGPGQMRARGMVTPGTAAITTNSGARRRANARAGGPKMRARSCSAIGSSRAGGACNWGRDRTSARVRHAGGPRLECKAWRRSGSTLRRRFTQRSEEHTSELQSRGHLVCRLLLEKKKKKKKKKVYVKD